MTGWRLAPSASVPLHGMSFLRHGRSIHPMCLALPGRVGLTATPRPHRLDESEPTNPWLVGLHQSPPPLHRPVSILDRIGGPVNHHWREGGEFSTGQKCGGERKGLRKPRPVG